MKNKILKHDIGRKIGTVTHIPNFVLGIQGWLDGKKGKSSVPDARVEGMKNKCVSLEKREALIIETRYEGERKEGAEALLKLANCKRESANPIADSTENTPYTIRARERDAAKRNQNCILTEEAKRTLAKVQESLVHADTVLSERIKKTREKALNVKIAAYVKGVRKGGISDYNPKLDLSDDAYTIYKNKHENGDTAIFNAVSQITEEVCGQ